MATVKTKRNQSNEMIDMEELERVASEVSGFDIYLTIKRWEALYPHTYGDQILEDLMSERK